MPSSKPQLERNESMISKTEGELLQNIQNKLKNSTSNLISIVPIEPTLLKSSLCLEKASSSGSSKKDGFREVGGMSYARLCSRFDNPIVD